MATVIGWWVRVKTGEIIDPPYDTVLYVVGFPTPEEAVAAVQKERGRTDEPCEVLDEVKPGRGPQPKPGQVWFLKGAV